MGACHRSPHILILRLKLNGDTLEGNLTRPRHYSDVAGEGSSVTDPKAVVVPVQNATLVKGELHFTTPDPSGKGKPDESTMTLWDVKDASLAYGNHGFMPRWLLTKESIDRSPVLSTNWPSQKVDVLS
jgi:hypothetical protein